MRIAGGAIASATLLCSPSVQAENPGALKTSELPRAWTSEEADALAADLVTRCFPVRVVEPLPRGSRPKELIIDGVAVWMQLPDGTAGRLITPFSLVARARTIEVWVGGGWRPVSAAHGTLLYDLAELTSEAALPIEATPAVVATVPPSDPVFYSVAPIAPSATPGSVAVVMGDPQPEELRYYGRASTSLMRGYPLIDRQGRIQGMLSTASPDGHGVLLIGSDRIAEWHEVWDRLEGVAGLKPRVTRKSEQLSTPERR
jgi:hypothetical protein